MYSLELVSPTIAVLFNVLNIALSFRISLRTLNLEPIFCLRSSPRLCMPAPFFRGGRREEREVEVEVREGRWNGVIRLKGDRQRKKMNCFIV